MINTKYSSLSIATGHIWGQFPGRAIPRRKIYVGSLTVDPVFVDVEEGSMRPYY